MKQKNYIIKLLLKTWLSILCFSLLCTFCAVWLLFQNTKQSSYDNINIVYEGIFLTWAIIGVIMFSVGTFTLFLNYFPVIRYNSIYSFLSFFLVPMLLILLCGTEILQLDNECGVEISWNDNESIENIHLCFHGGENEEAILHFVKQLCSHWNCRAIDVEANEFMLL